MEKRRNCSLGANSPLFHNIFNISLTWRVQLHVYLLNVVNRISFSAILQSWYVEVRISRSISESPLEFEITRVDCMFLITIVFSTYGNKPHILTPMLVNDWLLILDNLHVYVSIASSFCVDCLLSFHRRCTPNFLKVVVHLIINDQWNQTTCHCYLDL